MSEALRIALRTGIELNVVMAGPHQAPPVILLHGFPESHRTWRELAPRLKGRLRLIMPDLRGFGGSDRPQDVADYRSELIVADIVALADSMGLERFSLVGHDLGGVVAWSLAQSHADRLERLAIINAPHPFLFQKSLIESVEQRKASQYISLFRAPAAERLITANLDSFFETAIGDNATAPVSAAERAHYLAEWRQPGALTAMLNWYRAAKVLVPPPALAIPLPDALLKLAKVVGIPTLVIWGMQDKALLPLQLDGLERVASDIRIVRLPDAGHFATWEAPDQVAAILEPFLAGDEGATAPDE